MFRWTGRWSWCASLSAVGFPKDTKYQISCLFHGIGETHDKKIRKRSELSNGCLANGCRLCGDKRGRSPVPNPSSTLDAGDSDWRLGTRESSTTTVVADCLPLASRVERQLFDGTYLFLKNQPTPCRDLRQCQISTRRDRLRTGCRYGCQHPPHCHNQRIESHGTRTSLGRQVSRGRLQGNSL